jgi:Fe-S cluster assembly protein SufD
MTTQTALPVDRNAVAALSRELQEPEWMTGLRLAAYDAAEKLELPKLEKTRIGNWSLWDYGTHKCEQPLAGMDQLPEQARRLLEDDVKDHLLVQHNSSVIYNALPEDLRAKGVIFTGLAQAVREHGDLVKAHFMQAVKTDENVLTALHAALWNGGVFLYVPKNVKVEVPLHALFLTDDASASFVPHVLIIADENSSVTYVDHYAGTPSGGRLVHNGVVEVFVKQGARVQFASIHEFGAPVTDLTYRRSIVGRDGRIDWVIGEMNQGDTMVETMSLLEGNGGVSDSKVICVGTGEQNINLTTRAVHVGMNTASDMVTRAVMRDKSTAIINGITKIEKGATFANGQQTERVLMLSPEARGDANPMLLIDEDEVMAGHAASVGQVNPEQVYYMMSRGLSRELAMKLIIYGFLAPIVSEIPISSLEQQLKTVVERKLGQ